MNLKSKQVNILESILKIDFEETYNLLDQGLNYEGLSSNKLIVELEKVPMYLKKSGELYILAKTHLQDMELEYEIEYNQKISEITRKLEHDKENGLIKKQITESMILNSLIQTHNDFYKTWKSNLNDQKSIVKMCEYMVKAYEARISTLQSINKQRADKERAGIN